MADQIKNEPLYQNYASASANAILKNHTLGENVRTQREVDSAKGATMSEINVRSGFNRYDKAFYRPEDVLPTRHRDIIIACQALYRRIGIVRNIIDLMADFASEEVDLVHPIRSQQNFYRKWAEKVHLQDRVSDFMRYLLRDANVIVRRKFAQITPDAARQFARGDAGGQLGPQVENDPVVQHIEEVPDTLDKKWTQLKAI